MGPRDPSASVISSGEASTTSWRTVTEYHDRDLKIHVVRVVLHPEFIVKSIRSIAPS